MLFFTLVCAVVFSCWRILGNDVFLPIAFVLSSAAPIALLSGRLKHAYLVAFFAVYGPFAVMATYTFLFVACSHCKATTWAMLPYGPGMIPVDLVRRWLDLPRLDDTLWFGTSLLVSAAMVIGLTWVLRTRGRWWQVLSVTGVLALCSFGAVIVLALIQA